LRRAHWSSRHVDGDASSARTDERPTVDVVSGNIKANIPARVSFQLTTQTDSRTILDRAGAETLLGQGDMLFSADNQTERLQGYFATDEELGKIVEQRS
jgi:S-DNA-T family DNA segregation ATPase FtsK/SpoIIIE